MASKRNPAVSTAPHATRTRKPAPRRHYPKLTAREAVDSASVAVPQIELRPWIVPADQKAQAQTSLPEQPAEPHAGNRLLRAAASVLSKGRALIDKVIH